MTAHCKFRVHADRASRYSPNGRVIAGRDAAVAPAQGSLRSRSNDLSAGFAVVQSLYALGSWREIRILARAQAIRCPWARLRRSSPGGSSDCAPNRSRAASSPRCPGTTMPHRFPPASRNRSAGYKNWLVRHAPRVSLPILVGSPPKAFCSPAILSVDFLQHRSPLIRLHLSLYVVKLQRHAEKRRGLAQGAEQSCDPDRSARAIRGCVAGVAGA